MAAAGAEAATLRADAERMTAAYRSAFELRSSAKERASVVDHLFDLAELAPPGPLTTTLLEAHEQLREWEPVRPADPDHPMADEVGPDPVDPGDPGEGDGRGDGVAAGTSGGR